MKTRITRRPEFAPPEAKCFKSYQNHRFVSAHATAAKEGDCAKATEQGGTGLGDEGDVEVVEGAEAELVVAVVEGAEGQVGVRLLREGEGAEVGHPDRDGRLAAVAVEGGTESASTGERNGDEVVGGPGARAADPAAAAQGPGFAIDPEEDAGAYRAISDVKVLGVSDVELDPFGGVAVATHLVEVEGDLEGFVCAIRLGGEVVVQADTAVAIAVVGSGYQQAAAIAVLGGPSVSLHRIGGGEKSAGLGRCQVVVEAPTVAVGVVVEVIRQQQGGGVQWTCDSGSDGDAKEWIDAWFHRVGYFAEWRWR